MRLIDWIGRLWGRKPPAPPAAPKLPMHWSPDLTGWPLCGASAGEPWTIDFQAATCPQCRKQGWSLDLQRWANTR